MSLRDKLNENPMLTGGIIAAVVVILIGYWLVRAMSGGGPEQPTDAYYTIDDGTTWFSDDAEEIAPFQHEGKSAVRAYLFKCADGKEFVGYLERYTDQAKSVLQQSKADIAAGKQIANSQAVANADMNGKQIKRPGDKEWVSATPRAIGEMTMRITCPDKTRATPVLSE